VSPASTCSSAPRSLHHPSLLRSHVTFHQKGDVEWAEIFVAKSKTDTYAEGVTLVVHTNGGTLCPVKWLPLSSSPTPPSSSAKTDRP
jgi:hypothetical protein